MGLSLRKLTAVWYVPEDYKGEDNPPRFKIRPLNSEEYADIAMGATDTGDGVSIGSSGIKKAVRAGLVDWENIGENEPFSLSKISLLPTDIYMEVASEIISISSLQENEIKNS